MEKLLFLIFENFKISRVQLQIDHCHLFLDGYLKLHPSVNMPKIFWGKCWGREDYFLSRLVVIVVNPSGSFKKKIKNLLEFKSVNILCLCLLFLNFALSSS